ncbi:sushi domain-containing protein 2-like [Lytechinus pictus]|uniref:sushi domain-containing protein 2-like n=1 Tax=Lytechinus pictus TaxID=7653 RepID=UPI0030B9D65E
MKTKMRSGLLFFAAIILNLLQPSIGNDDLFFPFGLTEGDRFMNIIDDGSTFRQLISVVFPFFDNNHYSLFVNTNGVISFLEQVTTYTPDRFPLDDNRRLLTPFWADVDTRNGGAISYREVLRFGQDDELFVEADAIIRSSFVEMRDFVSSWLYITTWDQVAFYGSRDDSIRNSFQAVLVTDGRYSFAIFNYGDINWTTGEASGGDPSTGLGGTPAQVGFNAGDGVTYYSVPGSQTPAVVDIETTSNIGVPGRWVFRTDNANIEGLECVTFGKISLFPLVGSMFGGTQVFINGPCFNSTSQIVCDFDGIKTNGRLLSDKTAICISPTFYKVGRIPLLVSLDDGNNYLFKGTYTLSSVEDVPDNVFSSVTESDQRESDFVITWGVGAMQRVNTVDIVVYGYQEERGIDFNGPLITLAQGVDYSLGTHRVVGLPYSEIGYEVGVIGIIDSATNYSRAILWSKVHVLQWMNGFDTKKWCRNWLDIEVENDDTFLNATPPCPCTFDQAQLDIGRFSPHPECDVDSTEPNNCIHKPQAMHCVRANLPSLKGGGQACCYDCKGVIINVFDFPGGGYSNRYHHGGVYPYEKIGKVPYMSHYVTDWLPWTYCCRFGEHDDSECKNFARERPSQMCDNYRPPPPALGNGDPHIATLDSTMYTFNGHGEYTMMNAINGTFILQARTAPLSGIPLATVFIAVAVRYGDSDIIHVQTNERRVLDAYVQQVGDEQNFTRIDFTQAPRWAFQGVSVTGRNITSDGIIIAFDGGVGLTLKESEGAMSIFLVAPDSFRNQTQGLMGTWNGVSSDDFLTPQGNLLSPDLTTEQLHDQFGLQWEIDAQESLFFYETGTDHESVTDRNYRPIFEPVTNPLLNPAQVEEVCGTNQFCIFDYQTTGSQSFAENSIEEFDQYEDAVDNRESFVSCPTLSAPANGSAIVTTYVAGGVARFVCDSGFEPSHMTNLTCQSNGTWTAGDTPTCIEVFVPTTIAISMPTSGMTSQAARTTLLSSLGPTETKTSQDTTSTATVRGTSPPQGETRSTEQYVTEDTTTSPQLTTILKKVDDALPTWSIVVISLGSVLVVAVIGIIIGTMCHKKSVTPNNSQEFAHPNPTFVKTETG